MKIKLVALDAYPVSYSNPVFVVLENHPEKIVGRCTIYMDGNSNHFADIDFSDIDEDIDENLYVYISTKNVKPTDNFPVDFVSLHKKMYEGKITPTLKESLVH